MNNEKIHKILDLCLEAKEHGHDCFYDYSGHVESIKIRVYLYGWNYEFNPDYESRINEKSTDDELDKVVSYLEEIINSDNDNNIKLNYFNRNFISVMNRDSDYKDYELSKILTNMKTVFLIPTDEKFNEENVEVIQLYRKISNVHSLLKASR